MGNSQLRESLADSSREACGRTAPVRISDGTPSMPTPTVSHTPLVLIIRDGWGENPHPEHDAFNAVKRAKTPVAERLGAEWPVTLIRTCGEDVGLPAGTMGNSEVGHQNIGAGRVVGQESGRISSAIRDGGFFENPRLAGAFEHAGRTGGSIHLLGLVSDGRVHSDLEHLFALIDLATRTGHPADRLFVHAVTDGRDTGPRTGLGFIKQVQYKLARSRAGRIGSVIGRYYAMDRDQRWDRVALAYACLTSPGAGVRQAGTAREAVESYYAEPTEPSRDGDEFIIPTLIIDPVSRRPLARIKSGDAVIFFNFRGDRPRQLTRAFVLDDETWTPAPAPASGNGPNGGFDRGARLEDLYFCTMTGYQEGLPVTAIAFEKPPRMTGILGAVLAGAGLGQFRCAETEKFAHVTFFFNDYREEPFEGERRRLLPSPRDVSTYDQKPKMSAHEVCDAVLERLGADDGEPMAVVNFANGDMVGHTGNLDAAVRAIEVVDECVGRIVEATLERGGSLIVTADHGNAEQMWDSGHDCPHTAHTTYDVPLIVVGEAFRGRTLRGDGRLADIAPTVLAMMGLEKPPEMTGRSLLEAP